MAWSGPTTQPFYVDLYLTDASGELLNLHASMQLGERRLSGDDWDDRHPAFTWGEAQGWTANVAALDPAAATTLPFVERLQPREGIELWLSRERFQPPLLLRFELRDFAGTQPTVSYPQNATRAAADGWASLREAADEPTL
jgi:hypothetical protein